MGVTPASASTKCSRFHFVNSSRTRHYFVAQIDHLKRELQHKKHDSKHYKMQIQSLEQEAKYLRSKQKDQERLAKLFDWCIFCS